MKAFEVKLSVTGGSKDQTRTVFVQAKTKKEIQSTPDVLKVWKREDMKPEECSMEIVDGVMISKENFE